MLFVAILVIFAYVIFNTWYWPLFHDAALMHYIASQIIEGAIPYRDIFDMNMPLTYLLHVFVIKLLGDGSFAWRVFDLGWLLLICTFVYLFLSKSNKNIGAIGSVFFAAFHISQGPLAMGQRDYLLLLFLLFSAYYLSAYLRKAERSNLILAGLSMGAGIMIKPYAVIMLIFLMGLIYYFDRIHHRSRKSALLIFGLTAVVVPFLMLLWLIFIGAIVPFFEIIFRFLLPIYANINTLDGISLLRKLPINHLIFPTLALAFARVALKKSKVISPEIFIAGLGVIYGFVHFFAQRHGWFYHRYPLILFLILLFLLLYSERIDNARIITIKIKKQVLTVSLRISEIFNWGNVYRLISWSSMAVIAIYLILEMDAEVKKKFTLGDDRPIVEHLIHDISDYELTFNDTVQVMDTTLGGVHSLYLLGIKQPTRFIYDFQFLYFEKEKFVQEMRSEFMYELKNTPPKLIVVTANSFGQSYDRLNRFIEFNMFLDQKYRLDIVGLDYRIYLLEKD